MAKLVSTQSDSDRQAEAEAGLKKFFNKLQVPPAPKAPASLTGQEKEIWELQQEVALLRSRYNLAVKIVWRTSAALVGLAAPTLGWDFISRLFAVLGGS